MGAVFNDDYLSEPGFIGLSTSRVSEDDPVRLGNPTYRGWRNDHIRCGWETPPTWLRVGGVLSQCWF